MRFLSTGYFQKQQKNSTQQLIMNHWEKIYSSHKLYEVESRRIYLQEHGIQSVVMDKRDSMYHFGSSELHVTTQDVFNAVQLLNEFSNIE